MDPPPKPKVDADQESADSSSDSSSISEEWQDLSKSDYAKVIFCNLYHDADNGEVGCKFQITDNVHEDPCDFVGLFRVGETQCLVAKTLSETECEEDGKLLRCVFAYEDLPSDLQDGFYQFQYITRDQEVCGASTPFEVKQAPHAKEDSSSDDDIVTENAENDFVLVQHILEKKNRMLEQLLEKFRAKNLALSSDMEALLETKSKLCQEKEEVIENLHQEIITLKANFARKQSLVTQKDIDIENLSAQLKNREQAAINFKEELKVVAKALTKCQSENSHLQKDLQILKQEKETLPSESEQRILIEQLDDQKFMISALEDSKRLALKEMSDLSESLSKRTKVLNQTRSELASSRSIVNESQSMILKKNEEIDILRRKGQELVDSMKEKDDKLKLNFGRISELRETVNDLSKQLDEKEAAFKKKDEEISRLREAVNDMSNLIGEKDKAICMIEGALALALKNQPELDAAEEDINKLLMHAFTEAEKYLSLVDKIVERVDFTDSSQEKAFFELKIMFFVLLGKMKKPNEESNSKENSLIKPPKEKQKKTSRTLPSCHGETSTNHPSSCCKRKNIIPAKKTQKKSVYYHNKEVQVSEDSSFKEASSESSTPTLEEVDVLRGMISNLNEEIAKKNAIIEFISEEKVNLLKSELLLQETVQEHAARISEAAELYKKQFVEIEKLKKKLKHAQRHSSKAPTAKVVGYESSSTAEEVSPLRMFDKAPPTKRPRKATLKAAEKAAAPKVGNKQPPMLKVLLKSYRKQAEKAGLIKPEIFKSSASSAVEEKAGCSTQEKATVSDGETSSTVESTLSVNWNKLSSASWAKGVRESASKDSTDKTLSNIGKSIPLRSISDSDTGEHVLRNSVSLPEGDKKQTVDASTSSPNEDISEEDNCKQVSVENTPIYQPIYPKLDEINSNVEAENPDLKTVQLLFSEEINKAMSTSGSYVNDDEEESFEIPCVLCNIPFAVTSLSNVNLMDHLENEHQISMCPVCGQLYEASIPKKYLEIHVNEHFQ